MFNATSIVIEAFIRELRTMYERTYGTMEPGYPGVISVVAQLALENIATSDAAIISRFIDLSRRPSPPSSVEFYAKAGARKGY